MLQKPISQRKLIRVAGGFILVITILNFLLTTLYQATENSRSEDFRSMRRQQLHFRDLKQVIRKIPRLEDIDTAALVHAPSDYATFMRQSRAEVIHIAISMSGVDVYRYDLCWKSIIWHTRRPIHFHFLVDAVAKVYVENRLHSNSTPPWVTVTTYDLEEHLYLLDDFRKINQVHPSTMIKPFLPAVFTDIEDMIVIDGDAFVTTDIAELWLYFRRFDDKQLIGLVNDYVDWTKHDYPQPAPMGGFNFGLTLMKLGRMRQRNWIKESWRTVQDHMSKAPYSSLIWGDQDYVNIVIEKHPEVLYQLPCGWNVQTHGFDPDPTWRRPRPTLMCKDVPKIIHLSGNFDKRYPYSAFSLMAKGYSMVDLTDLKMGTTKDDARTALVHTTGSSISHLVHYVHTDTSTDALKPNHHLTSCETKTNPVRLGIFILATGDVYIRYALNLIKSSEIFLCPDRCRFKITYYVHTDQPNAFKSLMADVKTLRMYSKPWPYGSLFRFDAILRTDTAFNLTSNHDYLLYLDADNQIVKPICYEVLSPSVALQHSWYPHPALRDWPYENDERSFAFIPQSTQYRLPYFSGQLWGGSASYFLELARTLDRNILHDLAWGKIAKVDDESHLNRFFVKNLPNTVLSGAFHYPEPPQDTWIWTKWVRERWAPRMVAMLGKPETQLHSQKGYYPKDIFEAWGRMENWLTAELDNRTSQFCSSQMTASSRPDIHAATCDQLKATRQKMESEYERFVPLYNLISTSLDLESVG
ncbi:Glycosyltransferase-like 1B [Quaeritorhiza haematococci]|nr:Glycosyltransferase-like 1B [Quaeritorhiza haematococci]